MLLFYKNSIINIIIIININNIFIIFIKINNNAIAVFILSCLPFLPQNMNGSYRKGELKVWNAWSRSSTCFQLKIITYHICIVTYKVCMIYKIYINRCLQKMAKKKQISSESTCNLYSYKKVVLDLYTKLSHYLCKSKQADTYEK